MKHLSMAALTYSAAVCQSAFGWGGSAGTAALTAVALAVALLVFEGRTAIVWAAIIGLSADALRPEHLGLGMFTATAAALVAETIVRPRAGRSSILWATAIFPLIFAVTFGTRAAGAALDGRGVASTFALENASVTAGCAAATVAALVAARRTRGRTARFGSAG